MIKIEQGRPNLFYTNECKDGDEIPLLIFFKIFNNKDGCKSLLDYLSIVNMIINRKVNTKFFKSSILKEKGIYFFKDNENDVSLLNNARYIYRYISGNITLVNETNFTEFLNDLSNDKIKVFFSFIVENYEDRYKDDFDINTLCPFCLLRHQYSDETFLIAVKSTYEKEYNDMVFRVSSHMCFETLSNLKNPIFTLKKTKNNKCKIIVSNIETDEFYNQCFFIDNFNKIKRFNTNGFKTMKKSVPLLHLNMDTYRVLSLSVSECFCGSFKRPSNIFDMNFDIEDDLFFKLLCEYYEDNKNSLNLSYKEPNNDVTNLVKFKFALVKTTVKAQCLGFLSDKKIEKIIVLEELYNICEHMSVLALLFFSSYLMYSEKTISIEDLVELINMAEDYASGVLQLIENSIEYAQKNAAYMRFKIINKKGDVGENLYYYDIQICDGNNIDMIETFVINVKNRWNNNYVDLEKMALGDLFDHSRNINFWEEYFTGINNLTHHYGIQYFLSVIRSNNGQFRVISDKKCQVRKKFVYLSDENDLITDKRVHYPGTEYIIKLPIKFKKILHENIGFGDSVCYDKSLMDLEQKDIVIANDLTNLCLQGGPFSQSIKEKAINNCANYLYAEYFDNNSCLLVFDTSKISETYRVEMLVKSVILLVNNHKSIYRIAFINASQSFIINFARIVSTFYYNVGKNIEMKNVIMYLNDESMNSEVVFSGTDLFTSLKYMNYLENTKGTFNNCKEIIVNMLEKRLGKSKATVKKHNIIIPPFDLAIHIGPLTLFEHKVKNDLMRDVQKSEFGCTLNDSHMKVGSKIHIQDKFYDASLLFASSYYVSRFAFLIAQKIANCSKEKKDKITLVGYESYSEMLLSKIEYYLRKDFDFKKVYYIIFEQQFDNKFKFYNEVINDSNFFVIVPINSTLTTHSKIVSELYRSIFNYTNTTQNNDGLRIVKNFALILIRDSKKDGSDELSSIEGDYWISINNEDRVVLSKNSNPPNVFFNVVVANDWSDPLVCEKCFPKRDTENEIRWLLEKPMLGLNQASVIPMILEERKEEVCITSRNEVITKDYPHSFGNIDELKSFLIYGHVETLGNHFMFYFRTELLMDSINRTKPKQFSEWMKYTEINLNNFKKNSGVDCIYDIIVAPLHSTNASFVDKVNKEIFSSVPIVLYIDTYREYRENIKTKYSNLTLLYLHLTNAKKKSIINFHYVDDTIVSGTTINRTKNLLYSLFPEISFKENSIVKINLFQSIILLLNRSSKSTIANYIDPSRFYRYIDLNISSVRTHHKNACYLCDMMDKYKELYVKSNLNESAKIWSRKLYKHKVRTVEQMEKIFQDKSLYYDCDEVALRERYYKRMITSNELAIRIETLPITKRGDYQEIYTLLVELICSKYKRDEILVQIEFVISYIKIASSPYLVYRKAILNQIFKILIEMLEVWLVGQCTGAHEEVVKLINNIKSISDPKLSKAQSDLFSCIIIQLSVLGSKYLVRKESFKKINKFLDDRRSYNSSFMYDFNMPNIEALYLEAVKRLTTINKDETICLWLDYLLTSGNEIPTTGIDKEFVNSYGIGSKYNSIGCKLFLENSSIIYRAIKDLSMKVRCSKIINEKKEEIAVKDYINYNFSNGKIVLICNSKNKYRSENSITPNVRDKFEINISELIKMYYFSNYIKLIGAFYKSFEEYKVNTPKEENGLLLNYKLDYLEDDKLLTKILTNTFDMIKIYNFLTVTDNNEGKTNDVRLYYNKLCFVIKKILKSSHISMYGLEGSALNTDSTQLEPKKLYYISGDSDIKRNINTEIFKYKQTIYTIEERRNVFVILLSDISIGNNSKTMDDILFYIEFPNSFSKELILFNLRNLLVFRNDMIIRLKKDFHNNSFAELKRKSDKLKLANSEKVANHTEYSFLEKICNDINLVDNENNLYFAALSLRLATDSFISKVYFKFVINDNQIEDQLLFNSVININKLRNIFNGYTEKSCEGGEKKLNIVLARDMESVIFKTSVHTKYEPIFVLSALMQNALKHGYKESTNHVTVNINTIGNNLVLKNQIIPTEGVDDISYHQSLIENSYGITLKALKKYFMIVYNSNKIYKIEKKGEKYYIIFEIPLNRVEQKG